MPSKKQRRRQLKQRRHEWEEVYVDEEGNEVEPPPELAEPAAGRREKRSGNTRSTARARGVQPPSWRRVLKRGAIFAPLMYVMIAVLEPDTTTTEKLFFTGQLALIFIPFSYFVDAMSYRVWKRRAERESGSPAPKSR